MAIMKIINYLNNAEYMQILIGKSMRHHFTRNKTVFIAWKTNRKYFHINLNENKKNLNGRNQFFEVTNIKNSQIFPMKFLTTRSISRSISIPYSDVQHVHWCAELSM